MTYGRNGFFTSQQNPNTYTTPPSAPPSSPNVIYYSTVQTPLPPQQTITYSNSGYVTPTYPQTVVYSSQNPNPLFGWHHHHHHGHDDHHYDAHHDHHHSHGHGHR